MENTQDFLFNPQTEAMKMTEKVFMQLLKKNNLLVGNKTFGVVREVLNTTTLLIHFEHSGTNEIVNCSPHIPFKLGDRVIVEYINSNPHDRFVLALIGGGYEIDVIDYDALPTEPVKIIRDDNGKAYKFIYAYDRPTKEWSQELIRNDEGKVVQVIYAYPDGFILIRTLFRDEDGKLERYE